MELGDLNGIGTARKAALHAAGIDSLRDLLYAVPFQYKDLGELVPVNALKSGVKQTVAVCRIAEPKIARYGKRSRVTCAFRDDNAELRCVWFNQPWMKDALMKRQRFLLFGKADTTGKFPQLVNPSLEEELRIVPVYKPIEGLPQKTHLHLVAQALPQVEAICPETLPETLLVRYDLMRAAEAIAVLHAPTDRDAVCKAQRRFAFEQLLLYQIAVREMKGLRRTGRALPIPAGAEDAYWHQLSFAPTQAQRRTLAEIAADLRRDTAMARMVQGDVGCGKTAIAFGAMQLCARAGRQAVMMAPTEILARQHYENAKLLFPKVNCGLLMGGMPAAERREALAAIAQGEWQMIFGTHALIGEAVSYCDLGLCVTDEQHRFGVAQRTHLLGKGGDKAPHLLVMSATPIPRSLALVMFGDLDVSVVDELPPGRTPVQTRIVPDAKTQEMYRFVRKQLESGRQAYIVCPLVEEDSADDQRKAVESH
ncbi:MAG: DEAD/DEAH box helicase, partial [Eubacteriales bacterium]|nr:DEAD/DEAH box helicase [Eubacteriales bacterium]